ncbi:MAG: VanZ family protein [Bacteroides sp.]|nr:VanZ family protein [Bacteroides sp.]
MPSEISGSYLFTDPCNILTSYMNPEIKNRLSGLPPMLLTGITVVAILWLTLSPRPFGDMHTPFFPGADKIVHGLMFGFLVAMLALDNMRKQKFRPLPISILMVYALASSLFGVAIEYLQEWLQTGRAFEFTDMVADSTGAFAAAVAWYFFQTKLTEKND